MTRRHRDRQYGLGRLDIVVVVAAAVVVAVVIVTLNRLARKHAQGYIVQPRTIQPPPLGKYITHGC